mmetsp:Transcript_39950/g.118950  ORF Transcript_39950/g.118950 Transcript_39950/m.118950 type:complete len:120 (+) Transcript_39950:190-549(+)
MHVTRASGLQAAQQQAPRCGASRPAPRVRTASIASRTLGRRVLAPVAAATVTAQNVGAVGLKDAPLRSLFPDEPSPPAPGAPKLRVAIVGGGLAGLSTAVELLDQGWVTRLELGPTASP